MVLEKLEHKKLQLICIFCNISGVVSIIQYIYIFLINFQNEKKSK